MMGFLDRLNYTWQRSSGNRKEFFEELLLSLDARLEPYYTQKVQYKAQPLAVVLDNLEKISGKSLKPFLQESGLQEIEAQIKQRASDLGYDKTGDVDTFAKNEFAQLYYVLCRAFQPAVVLETGVAYGRSSAYILKALSVNGKGVLHSIDRPLPIPNAEALVGSIIPQELKKDWHLHLGTGYSLFPKLLPELQKVDIFIHDSRHTYRNMKYEFRTVAPYVKRPGFVLSDDVDQNPAFHEWAEKTHPRYWAALADEGARMLGVSYLE